MLTLVIGNQNYSSWSLRAWLLLRHADIAFKAERIGLFTPTFRDEIARYSPAGKVPVLMDDRFAVWDTLAICEYVAEKLPDKQLWPVDVQARARARSLAAEMHSGFTALRTHMPMNLRANLPGHGLRRDVAADIRRIVTAWAECRKQYGANGPFLFGRFTCADAMFAPVCSRFMTYCVALPEPARSYVAHMMALPAMCEWREAALRETEVLDEDELYAASGFPGGDAR
jgi:glutathione S-transferase